MYLLDEICEACKTAKSEVNGLSDETRSLALKKCAQALINEQNRIIEANQIDMENGRKKGMSEGILDRLSLTGARIVAMAEGMIEVANLPNVLNNTIEEHTRPNGLRLKKVTAPFGVVGIIYEARPNVTGDAFSLCFKAGSVSVLKGGSDAINSNKAIVEILQNSLKESGITPNAVVLLEDTSRETATAFMKRNDFIDLLIPRGSQGLIQTAVRESLIPIIETGTGNCHIYVDEDANIDMAINIIVNAKTQRIGVCNAAESLVVHEKIKDKLLPDLYKALNDVHSVVLKGDAHAMAACSDIVAATEEDFGTEYLDYIMSVKTVSSVNEAIEHINKYSTGHSESIITENTANRDLFFRSIDSACLYHNASTRFTDGFEFGFGAEIGISTQKLHARGPMGLRELTTYKYNIYGDGQVRA